MNITALLAILLVVVLVLVGFLAGYFKKRKDLQEKAAQYIGYAEDMYLDATKAGGKRFETVVGWLDERVPVFLKPIITRERLSQLVQNTFDIMKQFAEKQLDENFKTAPDLIEE